ncbi:MAG: AMP-binding protein [Spirochaetales bacterium]|nr:AMP-binding protein [Spirochaetales bacterium]MCF7937975.1 AMP-binding protein [Spirochaetales bacterium]
MKRTILALLDEAAQNFPDESFVARKTDEGWVETRFPEVRSRARALAASFVVQGIKEGDRIAILSEGSPEWVIGEMGILTAGCVSVPLSIKLMAEEIPFRLNHSESKVLLTSVNLMPKVLSVKDKFEHEVMIVCLDPKSEESEKMVSEHNLKTGTDFYYFQDLLDQGSEADFETAAEVGRRSEAVDENTIVTISYTSGTTGNPKGIMLTHANYFVNSEDAIEMFEVPPKEYSTLLILPCDHSFAHTVGIFSALRRGISLYFVDARGGSLAILRNIPVNIRETDPVFLLTVPSLSGNFMKKIRQGVEEKGGFASWLFHTGLKAGIRYHGDGFRRPSFFIRAVNLIPYRIGEALVFKKIRKIFGNRLSFFVGGGALLEIKQQEFFNAIGIPVFQGYGLTEAAPIISSNTPSVHKFGTSGRIAPSVECRILDEEGSDCPAGVRGEIVIRGENMMAGYFRNEKATAETIRDGWLYTGDLGYMDEDGFLNVVGREKALLISSDGEKYSPEEIEEAITATSPLIDQVMLYNDHRKYTTALVVLDEQAVAGLVGDEKITDPAKLLEKIRDSLYAFRNDPNYQGRFPSLWIPHTFSILPEPFTEENRMINSTMKMVRYKIVEAFEEELDFLYSNEGYNWQNQRNIERLKKFFAENS